MVTFFAGDTLAAADLEDLTRSPFNTVISTLDSAAITNTETATLVLPSKTYKAGKAYEVWVGGGMVYSTATAFSSWNVKKGSTTAGAVVIAYPRQPVGGHTNEIHVNLRAIFTVGASDVTTQLVLCIACNSTNTVTHKGSTTGDPRHITVLRAGNAADWTNMPVLS